MRRPLAAVILLVAAGAALAGTAHWTGRSGGRAWRWAAADLTAGSFSLRGQWRALNPHDPADDEVQTSFEATAQPLAVVGTLLSYREDQSWDGGAHPSGSVRYTTTDVARPKARLRLTDFFPDAQVKQALLADPIVRRLRGRAGRQGTPPTAAALVKEIAGAGFGEGDAEYRVPEDLLAQFSFHHLEGDRVAVRLCVPWGAEVFRFRSTELGLLLPIPARLRADLQAASAGTAGFLTRGLPRRLREKPVLLARYGRQR